MKIDRTTALVGIGLVALIAYFIYRHKRTGNRAGILVEDDATQTASGFGGSFGGYAVGGNGDVTVTEMPTWQQPAGPVTSSPAGYSANLTNLRNWQNRPSAGTGTNTGGYAPLL